MRSRKHWSSSWIAFLVLGSIAAGSCPSAWSQDVLPDPLPQAAASQPPGSTAAVPVSVEQLAERLRVMEERNRKLVEQLEAANRAHDEQMRQLLAKFGELSTRLDDNAAGAAKTTGSVRTMSPPTVVPANDPPSAFPDTPVPDYNEEQFYPSTPAPGYPRMDAASALGPQLMWQTDDEEIQFRVHLESQIDARIWGQRDQVPGNSGFFLPRQRVFFDGNITKKIEYELSINRGLGGTGQHFERLYQFALRRPISAPLWPLLHAAHVRPVCDLELLDADARSDRCSRPMSDWAGRSASWAGATCSTSGSTTRPGIFNGSRNSFESFTNGVDFVGYLNGRPFQQSETLPVRQVPEPGHLGRVRLSGPAGRAPVISHRRRLAEFATCPGSAQRPS